MKKKPLFAVLFFDKMQPVKAVTETEARDKFLNRFKKVSEEDIIEILPIEESHKHYDKFRNSSI